ncbi:MAG: extracellular solute-binding protein [Clostridia bacterium]|nr:extracellular solute-binding protein [Clostridia bacterium]
MATKFQRVVALMLSAIFVIGCFFVPVSAADTGSEMSETSKAIANAKELLGLISYEEYEKKYSDETLYPKAEADIVISGRDYDKTSTTALVAEVGGEKYDGVDGLAVDASGKLVYKVNIPKTAKYTIRIRYWPTIEESISVADGKTIEKSKDTSIQRIFRINNNVPFSEAYYITLNKMWRTDYIEDPAQFDKNTLSDGTVRPFKLDIDNNEIRASILMAPEWRQYTLKDVDGFYKDCFEFVLEAGENELSFEGVSEPMVIESITLCPIDVLPSYDEYSAKYVGEKKGTSVVKIEAELPAYTSTNTIYPIEDRSSAVTSPCDTTRTLLNTIGGDKWQVAMQTVGYTFKVEESGMYNIIPRYRQNINDGMYSSRVLYIYSDESVKPGDKGYYDGVPFDEARELRFNYSSDWQTDPLRYGIVGKADGEKTIEYINCEFYFEAGVEYTIEFEVALGTMSDIVRKVDSSLTTINNAYLNIMKLTGAEPDENRDYSFSSVMPDTVIDLIIQSTIIKKIAAELTSLAGVKSSNVATLEKVGWLLERMGSDPETEIAKNLKQLKSYIGSLGTWLSDAKTQPLGLDYIMIQSSEEKMPTAKANFFQSAWHEIKSFIQSFFRNYDRMGASDVAENMDTIEVWMSSGRDQTQVMRNLINNEFTPSTNIAVDLKLVAGGTLLPSILSGRGPDVYVGLGDDSVINYAIRGALVEVEDMKGFTDLLYYKVDNNYNTLYDENGDPIVNPIANFNDAAMYVLGIPDADNFMHYYGLPETQNFPMMFIRTDILADLGIECLDTWDDLREAATVLSQNSMTIGLSNDYKIFLYQMGGTLFADEGMRINLDSNVALDSFETMCDLFTQYSFPYKYDFVNRFRTGEMPIGIASYNGTYNHLIVFATELRGLWEFVPLPGIETVDANGNKSINNVSVSSVSAIVMIHGVENKEAAWEFMKWHSGSDCQINYSNEMVAILGDSAKHATANIKALKSMPWTNKEYTNLISQFDNLASIPNYPGAYIIGRYTKFAFLNAYNDAANPVNELLGYIATINKEITRKRNEFGLETLEVGETLASKRFGQMMDAFSEEGDKLNYDTSLRLSDADKKKYASEIEAVKKALMTIDEKASFSVYCETEYINALRNAGEALAKACSADIIAINEKLSADAQAMAKVKFETLKNAEDGKYLTAVSQYRDVLSTIIHKSSEKDSGIKENITAEQILLATVCEYIEECADALAAYQASYPID